MYNTYKHASTGFTPFYLLHGYEVGTTLELNFLFAIRISDGEASDVRVHRAREVAKAKIDIARQRQKVHFDRCHREGQFTKGQLVLFKLFELGTS